ncbi:hypothetical protein [Actinoallomurus sp. NPDC050550]|uniref:hypothetical protein n=1 Tax=Actinoallomurus sp. NPDC050550 TaxID=3154937 RepID=UPI0033CE93BE
MSLIFLRDWWPINQTFGARPLAMGFSAGRTKCPLIGYFRALAATGLLDAATQTRDTIEQVYALLQQIANEDMRTGAALLATVPPPDQCRSDCAYAIAAALLESGQGGAGGAHAASAVG